MRKSLLFEVVVLFSISATPLPFLRFGSWVDRNHVYCGNKMKRSAKKTAEQIPTERDIRTQFVDQMTKQTGSDPIVDGTGKKRILDKIVVDKLQMSPKRNLWKLITTLCGDYKARQSGRDLESLPLSRAVKAILAPHLALPQNPLNWLVLPDFRR